MTNLQRIYAAALNAATLGWAFGQGRPLNAAQWAILAMEAAPANATAADVRRIAFLAKAHYAAEAV